MATCLREQRVVDPSILFTFWARPLLPGRPAQGGSFSCNPPQTCARALASSHGSSTSHWVLPAGVSDKLHAP